MILKRDLFSKDGVFGVLSNRDGSFRVQTLEHAYLTPTTIPPDFYHFSAKLPSGLYICKRGMHRLERNPDPFETFEIMDVPDHDNILFHPGNTMDDSHGCVLLGLSRVANKEILQSRVAFNLFMENMKYVDQFDLEVS